MVLSDFFGKFWIPRQYTQQLMSIWNDYATFIHHINPIYKILWDILITKHTENIRLPRVLWTSSACLHITPQNKFHHPDHCQRVRTYCATLKIYHTHWKFRFKLTSWDTKERFYWLSSKIPPKSSRPLEDPQDPWLFQLDQSAW